MAIGGFSGSDPTPTLAQFEKLVASHEIHYYVAGGGGAGGAGGAFGGGALGDRASDAGGDTGRAAAGPGAGAIRGGRSTDASQVEAWVEAHFTAQTVGGETVYNLTAPKPAA
jgi:hypothetical protein